MAGRSISRLALVAFAASALLGACVQHVDEQAAAAPPPPPPEQPVLMGAAATDATPAAAPVEATAADAATTLAQANEDAYIASLPPGLMAVHVRDGATGRMFLRISNYPIANPALRARLWHARHHPILNGGPNKGTPLITTASSGDVTVSGTVTATSSATPAPTTMAQVAPTAPAQTHSAVPATQTAGFKGVTLSPGMWLIGGIALLAIVILVMLAGRKPQRREPLRA